MNWIKKQILTLILCVALMIAMAAFSFSCWAVGMFEKPTMVHLDHNKFEDMVNASVYLFDDFESSSGVFIADNVILTAAHCLEDKTSINIEIRDGTILDSNDFYIDKENDIGFIYIDTEELHIVKLSNNISKIGDTVFHVGTPYHADFKFSLAKGVISFINRDSPMPKWSMLIQTDIDGGRGNSGGPLFNLDGILIGMYVGQSSWGGLSISLYIPANQIKTILSRYNDR